MYTLGRRIGNGGYKTCYECVEDPRKVLLLPHYPHCAPAHEKIVDANRVAQVEYENLQKLLAIQLPVFEAQLVTVNDMTVPAAPVSRLALFGDRYDFAFKNPCSLISGSTGNFADSRDVDWLREEHAIALNTIADRLASAGMYVDDPQYLAMFDGRLVIADPNSIHTIELTRKNFHTDAIRANANVIRQYIREYSARHQKAA